MQRERVIFPNEPYVHTPWGVADYARDYAEGITFYGTPSHGGFKLSAERLARMHPALRERGGWFEEDAAWAKVAFVFPEVFPEKDREAAVRTMKEWYPDDYEAATGETVGPGESFIRDHHLFLERHADGWIVISAISSGRHPGMVECIATKGGKRGAGGGSDPQQRRYLVPDEEYSKRGAHGFVIDETRHRQYAGESSFPVRRAAR